MSKVYKGYELMKAIANGEIEEGSRFKVKALWNGSYFYYNRIAIVKYKNIVYEEEEEIITSWTIINSEFELIEDETIDIESIEELVGTIDIRCNNKIIEAEDYFYNTYNIVESIKSISDKQKELIQAVKQLNQEIKSIKEK